MTECSNCQDVNYYELRIYKCVGCGKLYPESSKFEDEECVVEESTNFINAHAELVEALKAACDLLRDVYGYNLKHTKMQVALNKATKEG